MNNEHDQKFAENEEISTATSDGNGPEKIDSSENPENAPGEPQNPEKAPGEPQEFTMMRKQGSEYKWFVVHTYSGFEEKARQGVYENAKNKNMLDSFGEIIIPQTVKESVTKTGKKRQTTRTSFPGYIIIQMIMDEKTRHLVVNTPKITGFVGNQQKPRPLPDGEVLRLTEPETAKAKKVEREVQFEKGEGVKVIDGPFSNFDGVIDEVRPEKARLRVLVSIFGRETPVELEYGQVVKLNP